MITDALLYLDIGHDTAMLAVEHKLITEDELMDAHHQWQDFLAELSKEWPPQRIKDWLLEKKRKAYTFYRDKHKEIEEKNYQDRKRGVPYSERAIYSKKLVALEKLMAETQAEGKKFKAIMAAGAHQYITPADMEWVKNRGFEYVLNSNTM